jgi:nucleotide-binding universal stress UspA family protein
MIAMRTILCPVDFSDATSRQVTLAAALTRLFGARLVVHHNLTSLGIGASVGWMYSGDHRPLSQETVGQRLKEVALASAPGVEVDLRVTEGPASSSVLAISDAVNADLIVLSTHKVQTEDHRSLTANVLERTHRSVLALHDHGADLHTLGFDPASTVPQVTLVPTDLAAESRGALQFAFELARTLPLELHLLRILPHHRLGSHHHATDGSADEALRALIPDDLKDRARVHVQEGKQGSTIVQAASDLAAACIVMCEPARSPLRRWFGQDTSQAVLHDAPCPVWYVPASRPA